MNPWEEMPLPIYEAHMSLPGVGQLPAMEALTRRRLLAYPARSVMIFGVAGGNGLAGISPEQVDFVAGVDISAAYLDECRARYPALAGKLRLIRADLSLPAALPRAKLLIADLFIEYIGIPAFCARVRECAPDTLCCAIQKNGEAAFVSPSPYAAEFGAIGSLHRDVEEAPLTRALGEAGYTPVFREEIALPGGKFLIRLDYARA